MAYIDLVSELPKAIWLRRLLHDGRWRSMAHRLAEHYQLTAGQKVLDVGCGMVHFLYELTQEVLGLM